MHAPERQRFHTAPSRLRKRDVPAVWDLFALDDRANNPNNDDDDASSVASHSHPPSIASEDTQQSDGSFTKVDSRLAPPADSLPDFPFTLIDIDWGPFVGPSLEREQDRSRAQTPYVSKNDSQSFPRAGTKIDR